MADTPALMPATAVPAIPSSAWTSTPPPSASWMPSGTTAGLPSWLGPQPPPPDPRVLSNEFGQLLPYVGQLGGMSQQDYAQYFQYQADMQAAMTQENADFQWNFMAQHYPEMMQMQLGSQQDIYNQQFAQFPTQLGQQQQVYDQQLAQQQQIYNQQFAQFPTQLAQQQQLYDQSLTSQRQAADMARGDATQWLINQAPGATWAYQNADPGFANSINQLGALQSRMGAADPMGRALDAQALSMMRSGGPTSPFTTQLDQQALAQLKLGGRLSPEEERAAQQSAREAFAARGQAMGDPAALAEVLNRDSAVRARAQENQAFGAQREAAGLQRLQYGQAFGASREAAALQRDTADRSFGLSAAQFYQQANPTNAILGMSYAVPGASLTPTQIAPAQMATSLTPTQMAPIQSSVNLAPGQSLGYTPFAPTITTPDRFTNLTGSTLGYGSDLFGSNQSMQGDLYNSWLNNAAAISGAQTQANATTSAAQTAASGQMTGSLIGAGATIGAAALGAVGTSAAAGGTAAAASAAASAAFCWVARAVYGEQDRRWRTFRAWLAVEAPKELREFYCQHGQNIARLVNPSIRAVMRTIMDPITS